jgi:tetratricopeptide (TPR) repeat protein
MTHILTQKRSFEKAFERQKRMASLRNQAIQTALVGDWQTAISINQSILQDSPNDIDTLNRLGFAFMSIGDVKQAKSLYEKVLSLDMKNPIAIRNIKRLGDAKNLKGSIPLNNLFIEEPGKTKVIDLLNIADKKVISRLRAGEQISLCIKRMKIFALDGENQYIGMLPEDISQRLMKFMESGNKYDAYIRTVDNNKVAVFIREIKRVSKFKNQPSFISTDKVKLSLENNTLSIKVQKGKTRDEDTDDAHDSL